MSLIADIEQGIDRLLSESPYGMDSGRRQECLLALLKNEIAYACDRNASYANYIEHWPGDFRSAEKIVDLPYLPVGVFKANPPLSLVSSEDVKRTLTSSATTGQVPSRIVLDSATSRRMGNGALTIVRDFIGSARRPYLVIDTPQNLVAQRQIGARGAAIQVGCAVATEIVCCLQPSPAGEPHLDLDRILDVAAQWKNSEILVYGFTYVIWTQFVQPMKRAGIKLNLPNTRVLHSGGWKRLQQQAVTRDAFSREVGDVFGCPTSNIIDYYGMVENVGVIYPDCEYGNKHVPAFAEVLVRDPLTLAPVAAGGQGLIQVCSALPTSFPGFLLLTEDMAEVISYDGCSCGRKGPSFRFAGRVAKAEMRGCGNLESMRQKPEMVGVA
jgi:Acyl-protein synthetase, LuxE